MGRLISVVATRPASVAASTAQTDDDMAIDAVLAKLHDTRAHNSKHTVDRASSVRELADVLDGRAPTPEDVVQIVGHASPGILSLGRAWTDKYKGDEGVYCLDSNPYTYDLLDGCIPAGCTVCLVGCSVGEDRGKLPNDGPTLMFDLARLWSATVGGAVGYVGPEDFDADGRFIAVLPGSARGRTRLVVARDRAVSTATVPMPAIEASDSIPLPAISRVISMPALGRLEDGADVRNVADSTLRDLGELRLAPVVRPPAFALPEVVFELRDGGRLELLANTTTIRITTTGAGARYYAPANEADVGALLGHVGGMVTSALQ